ncbi:unnamed protein product [Protopolystoma xenopodis]|uniref:Uncharacterized protein n=1 Tax=Protopolystoma xenopodis TaxID=117903 RepID=A0A448WY47_9PLAT|nr:unnamed protein product [Protopolystoma xenopodis]
MALRYRIYNYEEYLLVREREEDGLSDGPAGSGVGLTLRRGLSGGGGVIGGGGAGGSGDNDGTHLSTGMATLLRDQDKMDRLRRKLHTDDDRKCLCYLL